ncbi:MAG: S1 RNA-binding domain-containing protein [Clostridia bacterium]|nr:S1 RNA-binding domain-containing protein [Clostridia bacterium]
MAIELGSIIEGKVSRIMPFGVFVALPEDKVGLLHISEASTTYIEDINEHFKIGDIVKVKVIKIDDSGKISLSVKKAVEKKKENKKVSREKSNEPIRPAEFDWGRKNDEELSFEDKLSKFKQDSDERMLALKRSNDSKRSGGYRRGGNSY